MAEYKVVKVPTGGAKITMGANKKVQVPDNPIIPYIEGDGTGRDIWRASARVFDAAVEKAYKGKKKIHWMEVYAGEKSFKQYNSWLHEETVPAFTEFLVGIKGPLTTPIGGGMTSSGSLEVMRATKALFARSPDTSARLPDLRSLKASASRSSQPISQWRVVALN